MPFYLRAGKRMPKRVTEVALRFRDVPHHLFGLDNPERREPNTVAMQIQPDEQITLRLKEALALIDVRVLDHFIIGDGECVSFAERGLL